MGVDDLAGHLLVPLVHRDSTQPTTGRPTCTSSRRRATAPRTRNCNTAAGETCNTATNECVGRACNVDADCDTCQTCTSSVCTAPDAATSLCLQTAEQL